MTQSIAHPIAYLSFDGNCAEAMRFYERVLDGKLKAMITNGETPMAAQLPPGSEHRIMHALLEFKGGGSLMAGDHMGTYEGMKGFMLALMYDTVAEAERAFGALAEGGKVTMPLGPTFWAKSFGMVTDRFGTSWSINGESIPN